MFLLASMRMRWFSRLIAILCFPFSLLATFLIAVSGRLEGEGSDMDPPWMAFGENTTNLAHSNRRVRPLVEAGALSTVAAAPLTVMAL